MGPPPIHTILLSILPRKPASKPASLQRSLTEPPRPPHQVSEYAVDSLKQLALKFVYKEELEGFNFQRLFLSPFESIFVATQHKEIKVLVLDCVQNLVQARSGWKSIFSVLAFAKDGSGGPTFPMQAWEVVRRLVDEQMGSLVYDFLDVTKV